MKETDDGLERYVIIVLIIKNKMNKKIFVGMPSGDWFPYPEVIFQIMQQEMPEGYELVFSMENIVSGSVVHTARNMLVKKFLSTNCDYLWRCDDDNPPSSDVLKYLIAADKDVCSALVPIRHWNYMLNIFKDWKNMISVADEEDLFEVDNIWTWCVLLSRQIVKDVFAKTRWRPYQFLVSEFVWNKKKNIKEIYVWQDKEKGWEDTYISINGKISTLPWETWEDLYFWMVAKELWYKFYADKRATCRHYKNKPEFYSVKQW